MRKYAIRRLLQLPRRKKYRRSFDEYGIVDHYEESAFAIFIQAAPVPVSVCRSECKKKARTARISPYSYFRDNSLPVDPNRILHDQRQKRLSGVSFQELQRSLPVFRNDGGITAHLFER